MLKKEIKSAIKRFDYVLKPAFKKVVRPAKDSRFYSMPQQPVVEVPIVPRRSDALEDVVDAAGMARLNAICDPDVKAIVIQKIHGMAKVRNQIGFAQVHGIILAVRNARRAPKENVRKSPQGRPLVFHEYTAAEKAIVSFIKRLQRDTNMFETVKAWFEEIHERKCECHYGSKPEVRHFVYGRDIENTPVERITPVENKDKVPVDVMPRLSAYAESINLPIKRVETEAPVEAKPKCTNYVIKWVETALTALRVKYTGRRVPSSNRAEYFGFAWYDDFKFGAQDVGEYYQGY